MVDAGGVQVGEGGQDLNHVGHQAALRVAGGLAQPAQQGEPTNPATI